MYILFLTTHVGNIVDQSKVSILYSKLNVYA